MPISKTGIIKVDTAHESLPLLKAGEKLDSLFFEESFDLIGKGSRVLAEFESGKPAVVYAPYGKGSAVIAGSFLGSAYHHFKNPNNGKFFAGLAEWLKIEKPVEAESSDSDVLVEARVLEGDGYRLLFGFNRGEKKTQARFILGAGGREVEALELESNKAVAFLPDKKRLIFEKALEPGEAWVVLIKRTKP